MLYTELTKKAMKLSFEAHRDQIDKGGMPYVFHPFHLADQMETEEETCAALLHDVVEDTKWTHAQIAAEGFPPAVMDALLLLTHDDETPYLQYVERLSGNRIAARVKLADLRHNSMPGRLTAIGDKDRERLRKYLCAQAILTGGEPDLEEMTLRLRYEIPALSAQTDAQADPAVGAQADMQADPYAGAQADAQADPAVLTVVLAPDGHVRKYSLLLPEWAQERDYQELYPLLDDLEKHGYSTAHAVSCL